MTTTLATAATLSVMVLHALFGCSWHHHHGSCAVAEANVERSHACPGHHDHEGSPGGDHGTSTPSDDESPSDGHEPADDCGDTCQFMTAGGTTPPVPQWTWAQTATEESSAAVALQAALRARSNGPPPEAPESMRRLPLFCVWRL